MECKLMYRCLTGKPNCEDHIANAKNCFIPDPSSTENRTPEGQAEFALLTDKEGQKAHDIIWGALVDAEAPLTDGLKWAMDFFKPQGS